VDRSVSFARLTEAALRVHEALETLDMPSLAKTTGSRGIHIYVPIERGPTQHAVWEFTKALATELAARHRDLMTVEYRVARRPAGRVLVDFNQNAWGRTLASIYSVRPTPQATVSMPVTWQELRRGIRLEAFHVGNAPARLRRRGDLWAPLLRAHGRFDLGRFV
jgi:bifunctional non-homologous end joining protein LigD